MITYDIAKKELESGKTLNCKEFFKSNGYDLEYAYALLLDGDFSDAETILKNITSLRADWALKLIQFMRGYVEVLPTYFQIRNFLEIDINLLILARQTDAISYILGGIELLYSVNCEVYKYIARVFMNNGYYDIAKEYLYKGIEKTTNDPELYFMACQYNIVTKEYDEALKNINKCLEILPEYYPAVKIREAFLNK